MITNETMIIYFVLILITILGIKMYLESDMYNLTCVISDVNSKTYCVRDRKNINEAADKLANAVVSMKKLVDYAYEKYPDNEDIIRLKRGFDPKSISETLPTSQYTAYSENKGEKLAFCLNNNKSKNSGLIDDNTLIFVAIHELSHIATETVGHGDDFWSNFKFLLEIAKEINIYTPVDYRKSPKKYCGTTISDNPYYDYKEK